MNTENNCISLNYRSQNSNHDNDLSVEIMGDNVDDSKLCKLLNTYLKAIGSSLTVQDTRNQ